MRERINLTKVLLMFLALPFITNCGLNLENTGEVVYPEPGQYCPTSLKKLSISIYKSYPKSKYLAYSVNNKGEDEVVLDECENLESFYVSGFATSLAPEYSDSFTRSNWGISLQFQLRSDVLNEYFIENHVDGPVSSSVNIKVFSRESCDNDLELEDEFEGDIIWSTQDLSTINCASSKAYSGRVYFD